MAAGAPRLPFRQVLCALGVPQTRPEIHACGVRLLHLQQDALERCLSVFKRANDLTAQSARHGHGLGKKGSKIRPDRTNRPPTGAGAAGPALAVQVSTDSVPTLLNRTTLGSKGTASLPRLLLLPMLGPAARPGSACRSVQKPRA